MLSKLFQENMKTNKEGFDTKINKLKQVELFYAALNYFSILKVT